MKKINNRFWSALNKNKHFLPVTFFVLVVVIASFLRLFNLGSLPNGLNRDEASLGYTAYSIQLNGTDERGTPFPLNIKSFGDWKLGGYVYTLVPFVIAFSIDDWVIRLPSTLAGIGSVILIFFITKELIKNNTNNSLKTWLPVVAALLLSFSPWHIHVSRIAYEGNLALFFLLVGTYSFLHIKNKPYSLIIASLFFSLTLLTYHSFQLFAPLFGLFLAFLFKEDILTIWFKRKAIFIVALLIPFVTVGALFFGNSAQANTTKIGGLSIFSTDHYAQTMFEQRVQFNKHLSLLGHLYVNNPILIFRQIVLNIFSIFSPEFLFISGGSHPTHHVPDIGLLHWFESITLIVGLYFFWKEKELWQKMVAGWIVLGTLPALITFEPNHPIRTIAIVIPLAIVSAFGMIKLFKSVHSIRSKVLSYFSSILGLLVISFFFFYGVTTYFIQFPHKAYEVWPWYIKDLTKEVWDVKDNYDMVVMQGESSSPYIYYLFYNKLSPEYLSSNLLYYPEDEEGFEHVKQLSSVYFQNIKWDDLEERVDTVLFVVKPTEIPEDKLKRTDYTVLKTITSPNEKDEYVLLEYEKQKEVNLDASSR